MTETMPLICLPCQPGDIAARLAESLRRQDLAEFQAATSRLGDLAVEALGCPEVVTCLCDACKDPAAGAYVRALLDAGVEPNIPDKKKSKAPTPLQVAAESNNLDAIKILLAHPKVDVAFTDRLGDNVFHWIVKNKGSSELQAKCIAELLQHKQTFAVVNHENTRYESAALIAARQSSLEVVEALLSCPGLDLDRATTVGTKLSARTLIEQRFPSLRDRLPPPLEAAFTDTDLMRLMDDERDAEKISEFCDKIRRGECQNLNYNDDQHTFLQRACKKGLIDIVKVLLESGADPVAVCPKEKQPPPLIASKYGFPDIVESFLKKSDGSRKVFKMKQDDGDTSLIQLLRAWDDDKSDAYFACLELLLDLDIDLNATNETGNSALHYAALTSERRVMLALLKKGAYIGGLNELGRPPIVNISYDILEAHFNDCIESDQPPFSDNYKIEFDYSCLVPPVKQKIEKPKGAKSGDPEIGNHVSTPTDEDEETVFYLETQPLVYMSRHPELRPLLKHPVLTSFLELKWNRLSSIYHFNTMFYFLFVVAISVHILSGNGRIRPGVTQKENSDESSSLQTRDFQAPAGFYCQLWVPFNNTSDEKNNSSTSDPDDSEYRTFFNILHGVVIALWGVLVLREVIQFAISPKRYFSPSNKENYVELLLIVSCFLFGVFQFLDCYKYARFFAAITILLTYGEFVLLVGRYPKLSTYIEMLRRVSWNFSKFLLWYSILILAFALSFYTLFRDSDEKSNFFQFIGMSVFKTVVMMTGEFEVGDIPFVELPVLSHVVFVMFVFLIAIVLFNLLNGLAVSDTQAIKDDAELVGYVSRVNLIAYIEKIILGDGTNTSCNSWTPFLRIGGLVRRVQLFPDTRHHIGRVVPNESSYLYLTLHENYHEKNSFIPRRCLAWCNLNCCCLPEPANCHLARDIIKRAEGVVAMKGRPSDVEVIKMALAATEEKLEAMENRWKKTEIMLRDILNAVGEGQRK